jgi:hypothetical protein
MPGERGNSSGVGPRGYDFLAVLQFPIYRRYAQNILSLPTTAFPDCEGQMSDYPTCQDLAVPRIMSFAVCCPAQQIAVVGGRVNNSGITGSRA